MLNIILLSLFTLKAYGQCADTSDTNICARSDPEEGSNFDCCGVIDGRCSPANFIDDVCFDAVPSTTEMGTTPSGEPCICQSDEAVLCPPGVASGSGSSSSSGSDSSASRRRRRMESSSGSGPCGAVSGSGSGSASSSSSDDGVTRRRLIIRRLESDDGSDGSDESSGSASSESTLSAEDDTTVEPMDDEVVCICTSIAADAADDGNSGSDSSLSGSDSDGDDSSDDVAVASSITVDDDDVNDAYRVQGQLDGSNMMMSGVEGYHMMIAVSVGLICVIVW